MRTHRHSLITLFIVIALAVITTTVVATWPADAVTPAAATHPATRSGYDKVMVIAEENETEAAVIGSPNAPYLTALANAYGQATDMQAGYPVSCPSLAAYLLITSGDRQDVCDDKPPSAHKLSGDNIFSQVAAAGQQWREYAESMPSNCRRTNDTQVGYLVRHAPPPYYTSEAKRCQGWDVPMGTTTAGALHDGLASGLPAYSFVTPNACDDMHGVPSCRNGLVQRGDAWLATWMPEIIGSADFASGRLLVIITWDEGSGDDNHIPTLVIGSTVHNMKSATPLTHCSTLRTTEDILGLPHLGCAATATSFEASFGL
jgi:phosphatidylinositol-3-phosphatase